MLKITGHSDDVITVEGVDINEELYPDTGRDGHIAASDGTLLDVKYDDYCLWRFTVIYPGSLFDHKEEGSVPEDKNDVVYFKDGIKWVAVTDCVVTNSKKGDSSRA